MISATDLSKVYHSWLLEEIKSSTVENKVIRMDTPFYDRHNDSLILCAIPKNNKKLMVTDDDYTLDGLDSEGIYVTGSKKKYCSTSPFSHGECYQETLNSLIPLEFRYQTAT